MGLDIEKNPVTVYLSNLVYGIIIFTGTHDTGLSALLNRVTSHLYIP